MLREEGAFLHPLHSSPGIDSPSLLHCDGPPQAAAAFFHFAQAESEMLKEFV